MKMQKGKIPYQSLLRSVLRVPFERSEKRHVARDGAFLTSEGDTAACLNTTVYGGYAAEKLAFYRSFNGAIAEDICPECCMLSLTFPAGTKEAEIMERMHRFRELCRTEGVQITGGHTCCSDQVRTPVLSVLISGKRTGDPKERPAPGDALILTGFPGDAGALVLLTEEEERLRKRFRKDFLDPVREAEDHLSCSRETAVFRAFNGTLHDVSEGGILAALYEFSEGYGVGFTVSEQAIPLHQETIELCEFLGGNPYTLLSTGCMLGAVRDGAGTLERLRAEGIPAVLLGTVTAGCQKKMLRGQEERFLLRPEPDFLLTMKNYG